MGTTPGPNPFRGDEASPRQQGFGDFVLGLRAPDHFLRPMANNGDIFGAFVAATLTLTKFWKMCSDRSLRKGLVT